MASRIILQLRLPSPRHARWTSTAIRHSLPLRRPFTSSTPLHLFGRRSSRPALGFLMRVIRSTQPDLRAAKKGVKGRGWIIAKFFLYWSAWSWALIITLNLMSSFAYQEWLNKLYPSPAEWGVIAKKQWRLAQHELAIEGGIAGFTQWSAVATGFRNCLLRVEMPVGLWSRGDAGIVKQDDWDRSIPGVTEENMQETSLTPWISTIGLDVTAKDDNWRAGYFDAMINMCRASQNIVGYLRPKDSIVAYPPEYVRSEDNPYPKPMPGGLSLPNVEIEDCDPVFDAPDFLYRRLLTTRGWNRDQRIEAAIAWGIWNESQGRTELAGQLFQWSLDLALESSPDIDSLIDKKTLVIKGDARGVSSNILEAVEAMARHRIQENDISAALNIFLSVLRARRAAPEAPASRKYETKKKDLSLNSLQSWVNLITVFPFEPEYCGVQRSKDLPFERTLAGECKEAGLMLYVGEILFARSSKSRVEGLAWTRDATAQAQDSSLNSMMDPRSAKLCSTCLETGLMNWSRMAGVLAASAPASTAGSGSSGAGYLRGFGLWGKDAEPQPMSREQWQEEEKLVQAHLEEWRLEKAEKRLAEYSPNGFGIKVA